MYYVFIHICDLQLSKNFLCMLIDLLFLDIFQEVYVFVDSKLGEICPTCLC